MDIINYYNWRYATKKFNPKKRLSKANLELLKEAIRLAPTSYGLQLFKVKIVKDKATKEKLKEASFNQSQISDASHIFVFCNSTKVYEKDINLYMNTKAKANNIDQHNLNGYSEFLKKTLLKKDTSEISIWTTNQVYITLAYLMTACATLNIDSCPIEGFLTDKYNSILNLQDESLNAAVVAAVGYRSENDSSQNEKSKKIIRIIV